MRSRLIWSAAPFFGLPWLEAALGCSSAAVRAAWAVGEGYRGTELTTLRVRAMQDEAFGFLGELGPLQGDGHLVGQGLNES